VPMDLLNWTVPYVSSFCFLYFHNYYCHSNHQSIVFVWLLFSSMMKLDSETTTLDLVLYRRSCLTHWMGTRFVVFHKCEHEIAFIFFIITKNASLIVNKFFYLTLWM
jgi:hypothetical protein